MHGSRRFHLFFGCCRGVKHCTVQGGSIFSLAVAEGLSIARFNEVPVFFGCCRGVKLTWSIISQKKIIFCIHSYSENWWIMTTSTWQVGVKSKTNCPDGPGTQIPHMPPQKNLINFQESEPADLSFDPADKIPKKVKVHFQNEL